MQGASFRVSSASDFSSSISHAPKNCIALSPPHRIGSALAIVLLFVFPVGLLSKKESRDRSRLRSLEERSGKSVGVTVTEGIRGEMAGFARLQTVSLLFSLFASTLSLHLSFFILTLSFLTDNLCCHETNNERPDSCKKLLLARDRNSDVFRRMNSIISSPEESRKAID